MFWQLGPEIMGYRMVLPKLWCIYVYIHIYICESLLAGMPPKDGYHCQALQVFQQHGKTIERLGWKHMDPEEFATCFLQMLKGLGQISDRVRKSELKVIVQDGKFRLSSSEIHLFAEKVASTIKFCKQKLRDSGSGKFLPAPCVALRKIWSRTRIGKTYMKGKAKGQKQQSSPKKKDEKAIGIRDVFGLPPKRKSELVRLDSTSSSEDFQPATRVSSSSSAPSAPSSGSWETCPKPLGPNQHPKYPP